MSEINLPSSTATPTAAKQPEQKPAPTMPKPVSLAQAVNAAAGHVLPLPKGLSLGNTRDIKNLYFHGCIYSYTSARKTSTAARFGTPQNTRIIVTRREEQLIPLKELGYEYAMVKDAAALRFAMAYPERLWPDWAKLEDRTLVLDDATEAVTLLLDDYSEIDGKEVKDRRRSFMEAGSDLREMIRGVLNKQMHFVIVALAKIKENPITDEEMVAPDLPPSMMNMLLTELEFVFYIDPKTYKFTTDRDSFTFEGPDPSNPNKIKVFKRDVFAKHKLPVDLAGKGLIGRYEQMDLRAIWNKVQTGKAEVKKAA